MYLTLREKKDKYIILQKKQNNIQKIQKANKIRQRQQKFKDQAVKLSMN